MSWDPQKPPPWKTPGFLPLMLLMALATGLIVARGGGRREVLFGDATPRGRGLGDVPFRPRLSASASSSAPPAVPGAPSASAGP